MAKGGGKLTKLKSVLKKWHSFGKLAPGAGGPTNAVVIQQEEEEEDDINSSCNYQQYHDHDHYISNNSNSNSNSRAVYVGKSRRRYLIRSEVVEHPLFQELVERSGDGDGDDTTLIVHCEVVLFEHLLWMLQNADPQPDHSLHDLVDFYAC